MSLKSVTMYRVERFTPPKCPRCNRGFDVQNVDFHMFLGDLVDGEKKIRATSGYDIIIYNGCNNYTASIMKEVYTLKDKKAA